MLTGAVAIWMPTDNAMKVGVQRCVAFAGDLLQPVNIQDSNFAVVIIDKPGLLQPSGNERDATSMHSQHLRQELLGQRQKVAVETGCDEWLRPWVQESCWPHEWL